MGDQKEEKFDFFGSLVAADATILVSIITIACAFWKSTHCMIFYPLTDMLTRTHYKLPAEANRWRRYQL